MFRTDGSLVTRLNSSKVELPDADERRHPLPRRRDLGIAAPALT